MSVRKYKFKPTSQEALAEVHKRLPQAVEVITTYKPVYSVISKMLDCKLHDLLPEIELMSPEEAEQAEEEEKRQGVLAVEEDAPVELKGAAPRKKVGLAV